MFGIYTVKFKRVLSLDFKSKVNDNNHLLQKNSYRKIIKKNTLKIKEISNFKPNKDKTLEFLNHLKTQNLLKFFTKQILNDKNDIDFKSQNNTYSDFEIEILKIDEPVITDQVLLDKNEIANDDDYKERQNKEKIYLMTEGDEVVLKNIVRLSIMIIFISLIVIALFIVTRLTVALKYQLPTFIIVFLQFSLELLTLCFVILLFVKDIRSSEYENLKIIGDIDNFLGSNNRINNKLYYEEIEKYKIFKRFSKFMNFSNTLQ